MQQPILLDLPCNEQYSLKTVHNSTTSTIVPKQSEHMTWWPKNMLQWSYWKLNILPRFMFLYQVGAIFTLYMGIRSGGRSVQTFDWIKNIQEEYRAVSIHKCPWSFLISNGVMACPHPYISLWGGSLIPSCVKCPESKDMSCSMQNSPWSSVLASQSHPTFLVL